MSVQQTIGSRSQVWHKTAKKTSGGLTKNALMMNKHGRIVSRKKHNTAKKENRLVKAGFLTKKGHFGFITKNKTGRKGNKGRKKMKGGVGNAVGLGNLGSPLDRALVGGRSRRRRMSGGMAYGGPLSPVDYDGKGVGTSGVDLQFIAGNAG
jgi:hypothetical protein